MKNFYPHGHVMPGGDGSGERHPTRRTTVRRAPAEDLSTVPRTYSLVKFNTYRKRGKAGSPPATSSNPYDVLKKVDWLAIFSPWAIINRSKMYTTSTKQSTCATRTPANNAALKDLAIVKGDPNTCATRTPANNAALKGLAIAKGGTTVVPNIFSGEFWTLLRSKVSCQSGIEDGKPVRRERRGNKLNRFHTPFPSILHLLLPTIFVSVFICFSGAAKAQSRQDVGTAEAVKPLLNYSLRKHVVNTCIVLLVTFFSFVHLSEAFSQQYKPKKPTEVTLRIGDDVPEQFWKARHTFVNMQTDSIYTESLEPYRNKLLLLDFWASWCRPCLSSLAKLQALRIAYPEVDFEVIPVAYENFELNLKKRVEDMRLPFQSVIGDSVLDNIFPHTSLPHMVWIYNGKVIAKPKWDYATIENINSVLNGEQPKLINMLEDWAVDPTREFFIKGNAEADIIYEHKDAKFACYIPEHQVEYPRLIYENGKTILYAINVPLAQIYYAAFKKDIHHLLDWREGSGIHWSVRDTFRAAYLSPTPKQGITGDFEADVRHQKWNTQNLYSFVIQKKGFVSETEMSKELQNHVNECFKKYLGIYAEVLPHKILKYATLDTKDRAETLKRLGTSSDLTKSWAQTDGSYRYTVYNGILVRLRSNLASLIDQDMDYGMLIDNTGISKDHPCDFVFPKQDPSTLDGLQLLLDQFAIRLTIHNEKVPSLVIQQVSKDYQPI